MGAEPNLRALKPAPFKGLALRPVRAGPGQRRAVEVGRARQAPAPAVPRAGAARRPARPAADARGDPEGGLGRRHVRRLRAGAELLHPPDPRRPRRPGGHARATSRRCRGAGTASSARSRRSSRRRPSRRRSARGPAADDGSAPPPSRDPDRPPAAAPAARVRASVARDRRAAARALGGRRRGRRRPLTTLVALRKRAGPRGARVPPPHVPARLRAVRRASAAAATWSTARPGKGGRPRCSPCAPRTWRRARCRPTGARIVGVSPAGELAFIGGGEHPLVRHADPRARGRRPGQGRAGRGARGGLGDGDDFAIVRGDERAAQHRVPDRHAALRGPAADARAPLARRATASRSSSTRCAATTAATWWWSTSRAGSRRSPPTGRAPQGLAWSPDGREVWFTAARAGADNALHAVTLDGKVRTVVPALGRLILYDIAPDGRVLLRAHDHAPRDLLPPARTRKASATCRGSTCSKLSQLTPDGRQLLFVESGEGGGPEYASYLRKTDGSVPGAHRHRQPDGALAERRLGAHDPGALARPPAARAHGRRARSASCRTPADRRVRMGRRSCPNGRDIVFAGREKDKEVADVRALARGRPAAPVHAARRRHLGPHGLARRALARGPLRVRLVPVPDRGRRAASARGHARTAASSAGATPTRSGCGTRHACRRPSRG